MGQINVARAALGAIVAAVILFVAGAVIHGAILGADWEAWERAGHLPLMQSHATGMVLWAIVSLVSGVAGMWIYVGIRPRYGAGAKTAALTGFLVWLVGSFGPAIGQVALGNVPTRIIVVGCIGYLIAYVVALVAGAFFYKEA